MNNIKFKAPSLNKETLDIFTHEIKIQLKEAEKSNVYLICPVLET